MKIGIIKNRNEYGHKGGDKNYTHLIIETTDDVLKYNEILARKNADENVGLYFGYIRQNFRNTINDYAVHEASVSAETQLLMAQLKYKETDTTMVDYCEMSDNIVNNKCQSILKYVTNGKTIRINNVGGYCFVDDLNDYDELIEKPSIEQVTTFTYNGKLEKHEYKITTDTVVIENDITLSDTFKEHLSEYINEYDEFVDFKRIVRMYSDKELVELFVSGIKNSLKNIAFSTTGQDLNQIRKMHQLLLTITELTGVKLNLYISTHNKEVFEIFSDFNIIKLK